MAAKAPRLKFETERLKDGPQTYEINETAESFELTEDPEYRFETPVTGTLTARMVGSETLLFTGFVSTIAGSPCARCLEDLRLVLRAPVMLTYMTDPRLKEPDKYPELVEDHTFWYDGEVVYPMEQLRELLLLELPTVPSCELEPDDRCPIRGVVVKNLTFGEEDAEVKPPPTPEEDEKDTSLGAQIRRMKRQKEKGQE